MAQRLSFDERARADALDDGARCFLARVGESVGAVRHRA